MPVVIDEVIAESGGPAPPAPPAGTEGGRPASRAPDLDRLDFHMSRRRHRAQRLWAD
jgi:hypothetical protein